LETKSAEEKSGSLIEIVGGKMLRVEEAGAPQGTSIEVRDLFFNVPARKKFLKAESTELSHVASLVTHYALAHPELHFELHTASNALLVAPPVPGHAQRVFQIFGKEVLDELLPLAAAQPFEHTGLPQPPPWKRAEDYAPPAPGELRLHGFVSKPEIQKLNRNSIYIFVNQRLIRDRLVQHAITEAYRNILPPTVFPVVLLFLEMPGSEVDVNVHPAKTEVRFRQSSVVHDFVRDSVRAALLKARSIPGFLQEISSQPRASAALTPAVGGVHGPSPGASVARPSVTTVLSNCEFALQPLETPPATLAMEFAGHPISVEANAAAALAPSANISPSSARAASAESAGSLPFASQNGARCGGIIESAESNATPVDIAALKPLGQIRNSFIVAVDSSGLWIIDQHVAHERILFERVLRQREKEKVEGQRLLMPLIVELTPAQHAVFAEISDELARNGFEVEMFGARTLAVKASPAGVDASEVERMLHELLDHFAREERSLDLARLRTEIAASVACHAAIKVNMPLDAEKMHWLLAELSLTQTPFACPHGRPVLLRYSLNDIQKAFKRI
ncbi:MAG TPA: DNA mismatch repair endonuclease MutL, partial [Terriglobales bacterium]|nr:DNA mismatch repair endonuclease MutL [Terriglobales bacterium]